MLHDGLEFHNIAEMVSVEGFEGLRMQRAPESLRAQLDKGAAGVLLSAADCEIRFRMDEDVETVTLRLSSESKTTIYVYHGPFQGLSFEVDTEIRDYTIKRNKRIPLLLKLDHDKFDYDPGLIRICFGGPYPEPLFYHGHSEGTQPPRENDVPKKTYLSYGTSITHGTGLSGAGISYPNHVAWRLGYQLKNFGSSGCCLCEKPLADFLAAQTFDVATLELSVNMVGRFTGEEFRERVTYLVGKLADVDPNKPVFCITIYPYFRDLDDCFSSGTEISDPATFREVLRDVVKKINKPNLFLIEGSELLPDISGLTDDLIHPGIHGMVQIGEELARRIKEKV
jgi:lysophospholipase L1-like esterase